jgi:YD repeat-containing protein
MWREHLFPIAVGHSIAEIADVQFLTHRRTPVKQGPFPTRNPARLNQLIISSAVGAGGVMMTYGSGAAPRYFANNPDGSFLSPTDDFGTLVKTGDTTYTYTSKYGVKWNFDSAGQGNMALLKTIVDPHNLTATFTYANGILSALALPDGGVTTFNASGNRIMSIVEPVNRTLNLTQGADLTGITDVDGTSRPFAYDPLHHLTNAVWSPANVTYTYDPATEVLT